MVTQVREKRWSIDACVGYARRYNLFNAKQIPCTTTLYNMLWAGKLPLSLCYVPQRKPHRKWNRKNKRMKGRSIDKRPDIVNAGTEIGHWEVDTVVGHRNGHEAVVFTAAEKVTRNYIAIRIPVRTTDGVEVAISQLEEQYSSKYFSTVFKTMTADNGPEFTTFSKLESLGTKVYFAHPSTTFSSS